MRPGIELCVLAELFDARRVSHDRLDTAVEAVHGMAVWTWCEASGCTRTEWRQALLAALPAAMAIPLGDVRRRSLRTRSAAIFRPVVEFLGRDGVELLHAIGVRCAAVPIAGSMLHLRLELAILEDASAEWPAPGLGDFFCVERQVRGWA